jgi:hypothetical protein
MEPMTARSAARRSVDLPAHSWQAEDQAEYLVGSLPMPIRRRRRAQSAMGLACLPALPAGQVQRVDASGDTDDELPVAPADTTGMLVAAEPKRLSSILAAAASTVAGRSAGTRTSTGGVAQSASNGLALPRSSVTGFSAASPSSHEELHIIHSSGAATGTVAPVASLRTAPSPIAKPVSMAVAGSQVEPRRPYGHLMTKHEGPVGSGYGVALARPAAVPGALLRTRLGDAAMGDPEDPDDVSSASEGEGEWGGAGGYRGRSEAGLLEALLRSGSSETSWLREEPSMELFGGGDGDGSWRAGGRHARSAMALAAVPARPHGRRRKGPSFDALEVVAASVRGARCWRMEQHLVAPNALGSLSRDGLTVRRPAQQPGCAGAGQGAAAGPGARPPRKSGALVRGSIRWGW